MFAIMRGPVQVVLWMLIAFHAIAAVSCLKAGIYSIRSLSKNSSCEDAYLSYTTTGRTRMQSADAKRPSTWLVRPTSGARGVYTVSPSSTRLSTSRLSYSKLCTSRSVKLSSKGLLSWEMKYVPREGGNSGFSIIPAGKADVTRCRDLLGCRSSDRTPTLFSKGSSSTRWQVKLVKALPSPVDPTLGEGPTPESVQEATETVPDGDVSSLTPTPDPTQAPPTSPPPHAPPPSPPPPAPIPGPRIEPYQDGQTVVTWGYIELTVESFGGNTGCSVESIVFTAVNKATAVSTSTAAYAVANLQRIPVATVPLPAWAEYEVYAVGACSSGASTARSNGLSVLSSWVAPVRR